MRTKPNSKNIKPHRNNNSGKVAKKSVKTPSSAMNQPDQSVLRLPVDTSVAGLKQAVKLFETATPEVLHLLSNECDVIYECRSCRNLFRSLANFISHKRVYCTKRFNHVQSNKPVVEDNIANDKSPTSGSPNLPSRITARQDLTSILQSSAAKYCKNLDDQQNINWAGDTVHLQPIENTKYGVYQTVGKTDVENSIKNQVSELDKIIKKNQEVVLGPDGKIIQPGTSTDTIIDISSNEDDDTIKNSFICSTCKMKYRSKKTLIHHARTVHESFRVCYTCPCCTKLFSNSWSVHRHLSKVHRKSNEEVRRLRMQIEKKQIKQKQFDKLNEKHKKSESPKPKKDDTMWIKHFEESPDNQKCGGCGKRFERRAALLSHIQGCQKRIALINPMSTPKRKDNKNGDSLCEPVIVPINKQLAQGSPQSILCEKRIGIQVRMNYCKNSPGDSDKETRRSERNRSNDKEELPILESVLNDSFRSGGVGPFNKGKPNNFKINKKLKLSNSSLDSELGSLVSKNKLKQLTPKKVSKMKRLETMCLHLKKAVETNGNLKDDNNSDSLENYNSKENIDFKLVIDGSLKLEEMDNSNFFNKNINNSKQVDENNCMLENIVNSIHTGNEENIHIVGFMENKEKIINSDDLELMKNGDMNDSVGILTRYKVKSIFKNDNSSVETSSCFDISDHEELCNTDESSLKENLNDTVDEDHSKTQKKISQYIHFKHKQCMICLKKFKSLFLVKHHIADHLGLNKCFCSFKDCTYTTFSKYDCIKHLIKDHLKPHEKDRALSFVGMSNNIVSCDSNKPIKKRKLSASSDLSMQQSLSIKPVNPDLKLVEKDQSSVFASTDNDCSKLSVNKVSLGKTKINSKQKLKKKIKKKIIKGTLKKHQLVKKSSRDSTFISTGNEAKTVIGAQIKDGLTKNENGLKKSTVKKIKNSNNESNIDKRIQLDCLVKQQNGSVEPINGLLMGSEVEKKEENQLDAELRRMVMEVIFG